MRNVAFLLALTAAAGCREETPAGEETIPTEAVDLACIQIASCSPPGSGSPSDCTTEAVSRPGAGLRLTPEWLECLAAAGSSCDAVERCARRPDDGTCEGMQTGTLCEGDLLLSCWNEEIEFVSDCSAWGLTCEIVEGEATCQGDGSSCFAGDDRCERHVAVACIGFREARFDCSRLVDGRTCEMRAGSSQCVPVEASCGADFEESCDGPAVTFCSSSGAPVTLPCDSLGFGGCTAEGDRAVCGAAE